MLGTASGSDDAAWASCDLARALVRPDELAPSAAPHDLHIPAADADVRVPPTLAFGIREREQRMLFAHLPLLAADMDTRREMNGAPGMKVADMNAHHDRALAEGVEQANALARLVDLRNANAAGIAFENRRRVIEAFCESEPWKAERYWQDGGSRCVFTLWVSLSVSTASPIQCMIDDLLYTPSESSAAR